MPAINFKLNGYDEFKKAIKNEPDVVKKTANKFLVRGLAVFKRLIIRNPWRIGMSGGGAPVLTGNLRDTHMTEVSPWQGRVYPTAPYANAVHKNRPWLDYAKENAKDDIDKLQADFLKEVTSALAK